MKFCLAACAVLFLLAPSPEAVAQTLREKVQQGLSSAKDSATEIGKSTVDAVGQGATEATNMIGTSVESTADLMTNEATAQETRDKLDAMASATLERLFIEQPEAEALFAVSAGHAVFDTRKLTLAGFSGGAGRGVAVSQYGDRTYMNMGTAGVGVSFGIGGFETQVVILFENPADFDHFVTTGYDATAEAGTMFNEETENLGVRFVDGRALFVLTKRGWKVSATAAGTKYWADAALN